MAWRKTGSFKKPEETLVLTCDVCERDIGTEDQYRPRPHFRVSCYPNRGALDDQEEAVAVCSRECLRAFAANAAGLDRTPRGVDPARGNPHG
jgi:hypothetical protein